MEQPALKSHRRYVLYRVYCVAATVAWNVVGIWEFALAAGGDEPPKYIVFMMPFAMPALFMMFNLLAFPFPYSVFGPYEKTRPPDEEPLLTQRASSGKIGWLHATVPFFTRRVFRSGLDVSVLGVGRAFMPVARVERLERGFWRGYKLWHTSAELRNPLTLPDKSVFEAVQSIRRNREHDNTHPGDERGASL